MLKFFVRVTCFLAVKSIAKPYSLVHVHSVPDFLVFAAWPARLTGARIILDIHDLLPEFYQTKFATSASSSRIKALKFVEKASAHFADHVIVPNHLWRDKIVDRSISASRCSVMMNYPDESIFQRRGRSRENGKCILLYPGSLNWHQGLDIAIRAFAEISGRVPAAEFHIYGEGPVGNELMQLVDEFALRDRILFHPPVPLREVATVIEDADIGIVPKRKDTFGNEAFSTKTLEFMCLGVPVIVSDTKVDRYYFDEGVVTFFEGENIESLAQQLFRLITDKNARREQSERADAFVRHYQWSTRKVEYLGLVDALVTRSTKHPQRATELPEAR
jgi:glycosyltransferase involved in cell wall biosynthesis